MKVYISGPVTGIENENMEAFSIASAKIEKQGHVAINPHVICGHFGKGSAWELYMVHCLGALLHCDKILMLKGWENSRGARLEKASAEQQNIEVIYD